MEDLEREYKLHQFVYFKKEVLTLSREGREMDVITVSSRNSMLKNFEPRFDPLLFPNKK